MVFVSYDRTGNVLTADYAGEQTETNTYNELGLLTTVTTAEGDTLYQYDDASRLISVTQPNGETVSYTYDSRQGNRRGNDQVRIRRAWPPHCHGRCEGGYGLRL